VDLEQASPRIPRESKAPALISDSMTRLLSTLMSTFSQKSKKSVKRPLSRRAAMIASTTCSPTFRTALRP
jgi:hypothetical protein